MGATFGHLRFKNYVERDPAFCGTCHQQSRAELLWTSNEHKQIICQDCHHQSQQAAYRMLVDYSLGKRPEDNTGWPREQHELGAPINACQRCHMSHDTSWPEVANSTGHQQHLAAKDVSCLDCHGAGIHRFGAALDSCQGCHGPRTLRTTGMEKLHCLACHNFLTKEETIKPPARVCVTCHRAENVSDETRYPANAPMAKLQCWACHFPHVDEGEALVGCGDCHDKLHGGHQDPGHAKCADCHVAHSWVTEDRQCVACHPQSVGHRRDQSCAACHSFAIAGKKAP